MAWADPLPLAGIGILVQSEIAAGHIPGAVVLVGHQGKIVYRAAFGTKSPGVKLRADAIFDLASLTKPVATSEAVMQLVEAGKLRLDDPVALYWPEFGLNGKAAITVRQLLTHTSGLRPDFVNIADWRGKNGAYAALDAEHPIRPPGSATIYSDLNFIALGALVEKITRQPLDVYARRHIFAPLGMKNTTFDLSPAQRARAVPTDVELGRMLQGTVQDPTAARMGGVAGHAGLFGTADDLARFAAMTLNGGAHILAPQTVAQMTNAEVLPDGALRGLGWDIAKPDTSDFGASFGPRSFGHTGYTGTALWIDPTTNSFVVILTSRLYPSDHGDAKPLRAAIADLVARVFQPKVLPGIDVLEDQHFAPLLGKRVGVLTNLAGRDLAGRRTIDAIANAPGMTLAAIFAPEHGLASDREGKIDGSHDRATGLPVYSLYGATTHPTDQMLNGLDAIVIDLQDVGVRFYTYPTTVAYVMQAASKRGIEVYILDRPDPIDAAVVQGPVLDPALRSFTGFEAMPLRSGMTLGELANLFNAESHIGARLSVIKMQGYARGDWYDETGLPWINPSPNLRSVTEEALYPAVGMVEGANVSVGRGTAHPFELLGAPWIKAQDLTGFLNGRAIAGVSFAPADFTPSSDAYKGQRCHGVRITLTDRTRLDAAEFGMELVAALYRLYPDQFRIDATASMVGSAGLVDAIKAGADPRDLLTTWQAGLDAFRATRAKYLLYP